jgi:DNA-binding NarL/FixJ family response regulator
MHDIFITKLTDPMTNWDAAFKKITLLGDVQEVASVQAKNGLFWLHMNEDRQSWMQKAIQTIWHHFPSAKILVLANNPNEAEALFALSVGAVGYVHAFAPEKVLNEVKTVALNGGIWLGNSLLQKLIEVSTKLTTNAPDYAESVLSQLTKREKEVAQQAAKGLSNKEIARILSITERTVKAHLASIFERLQVKDRLHLALLLNKNYKI